MLCYLRFPGRILQQGEQPPAALCAFIAEQLGLAAAHFGDYAERDQTRREHAVEIHDALGLFTRLSSQHPTSECLQPETERPLVWEPTLPVRQRLFPRRPVI